MKAIPNLVWRLLCLCGLLLCLAGCKKKATFKKDPPDSMQAVIKREAAASNGDVKRYLRRLDSSFRRMPNPGPGELMTFYASKAAIYSSAIGDAAMTRKYLDSEYAVVKGREQQYAQRYVWMLYAYGDLLLSENRNEEAFDRFDQGLQFARQHLDSCDLGVFNYKLGVIELNQSKYPLAVRYLKQALREDGTCATFSDPNRRPFTEGIMYYLGAAFEAGGHPDSAIHWYNRTLETLPAIVKRLRYDAAFYDHLKGRIYGDIGGVYNKLKNDRQAEHYLRMGIAINGKENYADRSTIETFNKLAKLYLRQQRLPAADSALRGAKAGLDRSDPGMRNEQAAWMHWFELRSEYLRGAGDSIQALKLLPTYYRLRDSVAATDRQRQVVDLESRLRANRQKQQLSLLAKDNKIKNISLFAIGLLVVMAGVLIWQSIRHLRRSRRQVVQLTDLNTQIYEQNDQLQHTLQDLEQSQRDNTQLLQVVAHDLRNPVGAMTMLAELMLDTDRNEDDRETLNLIRESGNRSLSLVGDLLKSNAQKERLKKEPVDLQALLKYCVGLSELKAAKKQQRIVLQASPASVAADREKLWRVISNLIGNAVKFSHAGTTIAVTLIAETDRFVISVADQGIGIPADLQAKIFDMPSETKRAGTAGEETFGLGLAICRQIVEAHGGQIWFESMPEKGTTFFVSLPKT